MPMIHTLVLSIVIITLYAALFHLLWGKTMRELVTGWLAAVLGFFIGQWLGAIFFSWDYLQIGELHLLSASVVSWLFMAFARRLGL